MSDILEMTNEETKTTENTNPKQARRDDARVLRDAMPETLRDSASKKICAKITGMSSFGLCDTILCYMPVGSEVDIKPVIENALARGKTVGLPACDYESGSMEFYKITSLCDLTPNGKMQIPEPVASEENLITPTNTTMIILPSLLLDKRGHRIGYGRGMYDKYINRYQILLRSGMKIGVIYSALLSETPIPYTDNDVNLALVVTEKKVEFTRKIEHSPKWEVRHRRAKQLVDKEGNPAPERKREYYDANYIDHSEGIYKSPKAKDISE